MSQPYWDNIDLHFVDVETTSLDCGEDEGEIISISIYTISRSGLSEYHRLIKPLHIETANKKSLEINQYSPEIWKDARGFLFHAEEIYSILRYGLIIGHNVTFDIKFINYHLQKCEFKRVSYYQFDTRALVMEHLPIRKTSMKAVRAFFGWSSLDSHTAKQDAYDCMRLWSLLHRASFLSRLWWRLRYRWGF